MENITMTNATHIPARRSVLPRRSPSAASSQVDRCRVQGIAVPALVSSARRRSSMAVAPAPAFYAPTHKSVQDVAFLRPVEPPV